MSNGNIACFGGAGTAFFVCAGENSSTGQREGDALGGLAANTTPEPPSSTQTTTQHTHSDFPHTFTLTSLESGKYKMLV